MKQLGGMRTSQLAEKYIVKWNKIRNCTLLRNQDKEGVLFYLDKSEEIMRACHKLLRTWRTHGSPLGDCKLKVTMYRTISKTADELNQWRNNSSTDDTLTSLSFPRKNARLNFFSYETSDAERTRALISPSTVDTECPAQERATQHRGFSQIAVGKPIFCVHQSSHQGVT